MRGENILWYSCVIDDVKADRYPHIYMAVGDILCNKELMQFVHLKFICCVESDGVQWIMGIKYRSYEITISWNFKHTM